MSLAEDIAPLPSSGAGRRTILIVALILLGMTASSPPPGPVDAPNTSAAIAPWNMTAAALTGTDGQKPPARPVHNIPFLAVRPDPVPRVDFRLLVSCRQASSLAPVISGLTLPARVQADL